MPVILEWLVGFIGDALPHAPHIEDVEATYRRRQDDPDGAWLLWDDGGPVSLAGYGIADADRNPGRACLHAAGAARPRICDVARRGG